MNRDQNSNISRMLIHEESDQPSAHQQNVDQNLYNTDEIVEYRPKRMHSIGSGSQSSGNRSGQRSAGRQMHDEDGASITSSAIRRNRAPPPVSTHIRTDFTSEEPNTGTPGSEVYDIVCTPPGEPSNYIPSEQMPGYVPAAAPRFMKISFLLVATILGVIVGSILAYFRVSKSITQWLYLPGDLYLRCVTCLTLPMAFCTVLISSATLTTTKTLKTLWIKVLGLFLVISCLSMIISIAYAQAFRTLMRRQGKVNYHLPHAPFAFRCPNKKYLELQNENGTLACTGTNITASTTFPWMVDKNNMFGIEDNIGVISASGYFFSLMDVYWPRNFITSFQGDVALNALVIGIAFGVATIQSFQGGQAKNNPLLKLFVHINYALSTLLDWTYAFAVFGIVTIYVGNISENPDFSIFFKDARYFFASVMLAIFTQSFILLPAIYYYFTRSNPYRWMWSMAPAYIYALAMKSPFLPLQIAMKCMGKTKEVSPQVMGAAFPVMSALNRIGIGIMVVNVLTFVAAFSACNSTVSGVDILILFGLSLIASLGDTLIPHPYNTLLLTSWRAFCGNSDIPTAVLPILWMDVLATRLTSFVNLHTNVMIVRMISNEPLESSTPVYPQKDPADFQKS